MWTKFFILTFLLTGSLSFFLLYKEDKKPSTFLEENLVLWSGAACLLALVAGFLAALAGV